MSISVRSDGMEFNVSAASLVGRTIERLDETNFPLRFANVETADIDSLAERAIKDGEANANRRARELVRAEAIGAFVMLNTDRPDSKVINDIVHKATHQPHPEEPSLTRKEHALRHFRRVVERETEVELARLWHSYGQRYVEHRGRAELALEELRDHADDQNFLEICDLWVNTPDSVQYKGHDGQGYNGGIIHFFEYRADRVKRSRFKYIPENMSVEGFIDFTLRLTDALHQATPENVARFAELEDVRNGARRFYILLPTGEFMVAFQIPQWDKPRLATLLTNERTRYFDTVVEGTLEGNDRGKCNRLGSEVRVIRLS